MVAPADLQRILGKLAAPGTRSVSVSQLARVLTQLGESPFSETTLSSALTADGVKRDDQGGVSIEEFIGWAFGGSAPAKEDLGRVWNFSAGPSMMPLEVLQTMHGEFFNYRGTSGSCVMELSHRSKEMINITAECEKDFRDLLDVPAEYKVVFQQGGASGQFAAIPMNMMGTKGKADYLVTGRWGELAWKECEKFGVSNAACTAKSSKFTHIPKPEEWTLDPGAAYVHYCVNETVHGVEFNYIPEVGDVPLVADVSSNIMSRPIDFRKHAVVYAGIQKNMGPAGLAATVMRPDVYSGKDRLKICPTILDWKATADSDQMPNTPACWNLYVMGEYMKYSKKVGGVPYWEELSTTKSVLLYDTIKSSGGFYTCPVEDSCRSRINVPFYVGDNDAVLTKKFLAEAQKVKLFQLAGHRSVGGIRASLYNGMPMEGVQCLTDFMKAFYDENRS